MSNAKFRSLLRGESVRHHMVRIAGMPGERWIPVALRLEMDRSYVAFASQLSMRFWGEPPKAPKTKWVSVPRRLRRVFGRYVRVKGGQGRRIKDRRKHNRRWMPEQDSECDC